MIRLPNPTRPIHVPYSIIFYHRLLLIPLIFFSQNDLESKTPLKKRGISWLVALGKLNTLENIQKRRPLLALNPQLCIMCSRIPEDKDHLFIHCDFRRGYEKTFNIMGDHKWLLLRSMSFFNISLSPFELNEILR